MLASSGLKREFTSNEGRAMGKAHRRALESSLWSGTMDSVTQWGGADSFSVCASMMSLAPQSLQWSACGARPKAKPMRISIRLAEKLTMAWSITPLIHMGVQPQGMQLAEGVSGLHRDSDKKWIHPKVSFQWWLGAACNWCFEEKENGWYQWYWRQLVNTSPLILGGVSQEKVRWLNLQCTSQMCHQWNAKYPYLLLIQPWQPTSFRTREERWEVIPCPPNPAQLVQ